MSRNRRRRIEDSASTKSVQLLALAMFIMLLAFFIVLNSMSSFNDDRSNPILGSLENTFSTAESEVAQKRPSVRPSDTTEKFKGEGDATTYDRIRDLFRGKIARVDVKENKSRGIMMITVPYAEFSTAIIAIGQDTGSIDQKDLPFLPTLISLLQTAKVGSAYRMDMLLNTTAEPVDLKLLRPEQFKTARDKIGKLSRRLEAAGIPPSQMSIGMSQGEENMVDLIFAPYEPFDITDTYQEEALEENLNE